MLASRDDGFFVVADPQELTGWTANWPAGFRFCVWWARYAPRGRGRLPREMGRRLGRRDRFSVETMSGGRIAVNPDSWDIYTTLILSKGAWDQHVLESCCNLVRDGQVLYDIGASAGCITVEAAARFHDRVHIYAFEPQPGLARTLAISAQLNHFKNVHVLNMMLGNEQGTGSLFITAHSVHASAVPRAKKFREIQCSISSIDWLVGEGKIPPPDAMKIDVEGSEFDVLRGATETIRRHRPRILFESDANCKRFGYTRTDLCAFLRELADYRFEFVRVSGVTPASQDLEDPSVGDVIAMPD